jgi:hypothetical protein
MATTTRTAADTVVLLPHAAGIALIPKPTALTRLNYFDGKFLRASDLTAEQQYHLELQRLATRAGGNGVVHGFDLLPLAGDQLELGAGLAIDPEGRVLHMPMDAAVQIEELIRKSSGSVTVQAGGTAGSAVFTLCETAAVTDATVSIAGTSLYVLGLSHAEALCGTEDVFGKPCESACASGTERPLRLEGVVLRALPLRLATPLPASTAEKLTQDHLRSQVASAWFADEALQTGSLISGAGLLSQLWCRGAAPATGSFVPLTVIARAGGHTVFIDAWTARRERMDGPPRRCWQWRMAMRPWDAFLAQVLQFQCQLRDAWQSNPGSDDAPCKELHQAVVEVSALLAQLDRQYEASSVRLAASGKDSPAALDGLAPGRTLLDKAYKRALSVKAPLLLMPQARVLIRRGIVELPPAGYLPVAPGSAFPVNEQVKRLLGEGVDLRFCVVRPDFVAHALEEAQHMQRISLLRGLDNPKDKEEVDILVPDGEILGGGRNTGWGWAVRLASADKKELVAGELAQRDVMTGAARSEQLGDGALSFHFAGLVEIASRTAALDALKTWAGERDNGLEQTLWKSVELEQMAATAPPAPVKKSRAAGAAPAAAEPTPQELAARAAALREEAIAYRLKTAERVANKATTSGIHHFEGLAGTAAKDNDHTALWLALKCETDPFGVDEGARVDVSMDLSFISPKKGGTQFVDISIVGAQLIVDARTTTGQRAVVQGTLKGAALIAGLVATLANAQRGLQFSVPVILSTEPTADGRRTVVEVDFSALLFDNRGFVGLDRLGVRVQTSGDGEQAAVTVQMSAQGVDVGLAARLQHDDGALKLGSPLRAASETAIEVIATRETAANFAVQARSDLFGQRPVQADALTVRAKLDWVLFHRRRSKQCGAAPAAAVLEERRYEIYHLKAKSDEMLRMARAAVLGANVAVIRRLGFAPVGAVSYDGGRSSITTPTAALLQDWQAAQPGTRLRFGAIGSQGAAQAEGEALAQARLAGLELTLAQGLLDRAMENQVLSALPALSLVGWDGAIFLVTEDVITVCHDVYSLPDEAVLRRFAALVKKNGLAPTLKELEAVKLAHAEYADDGKTLTSASQKALQDAWQDGPPPPEPALVFHGSTTLPALAQSRSDAVMKALGAQGGQVVAIVAKDLSDATACAGLTVVVEPRPADVRVDPTLLGFANWSQGSFNFNVETPPMLRREFRDLAPADAKTYADDFKELLLKHQPGALTVATQSPDDQNDAMQILALAKGLVTTNGYTGISVANVQVLGEPELKALDSLGYARNSWRFAVLLNRRN